MSEGPDVERFEDATVRTVAFFDKYINAPDKPTKSTDEKSAKASDSPR